MARGKLWSVKGISPEARDAARAAAQESGEPIGAWIDQAIRMSDEDLSGDTPQDPTEQDEVTALEIVRVLEALETRVAGHADHIANQLAPIHESIAAIDQRLALLETSRQQGTTPAAGNRAEDRVAESPAPSPAPSSPPDTPARPDVPDGRTPTAEPPAPVEDTVSVQDADVPDAVAQASADTGLDAGPDTDDIAENDAGPAGEAPADEPFAKPDDTVAPRADTHTPWPDTPPVQTSETEPSHPPANAHADSDMAAPQLREISERDIQAADAALKSELTGLFDDGSHQGRRPRMDRPGHDPFLPAPPPPHRSSRAPLLFIVVVLLMAVAGITAFAWFQVATPELRNSLSFETLVEALETAMTPDSAAPRAATAQPPAETAPPPPTPTPPSSQTPASADPAPEPEAGPATVSAGSPRAPADSAPAPATSVPANPEIARLLRDATAGDAKAQNELGNRYLVGRGITQDYTEAARWLQGAAAQGITTAQYNLGVLYDSGRGVDADPTQALFWFHTAAEAGHGRAQMAMAAAYAAGRGIERNPEEALKWLRAASESNIADAQLSLANILSSSPENHQSLIDALFWYRVADANGVAEAADRADQVAARLTTDERAGVNRRVSHFISQNIVNPRPSRSKANPGTAAPPAPPQEAPAPPAPEPAAPAAETVPEQGSGTDEAAPAQEPAQEPAQVREIQSLLLKLGFTPGPADGTMGAKTRDAIRSYQKELGLPVTGEPSGDLLSHLRSIAGTG